MMNTKNYYSGDLDGFELWLKDFDTEAKIMDEIYKIDKNLTLIIIAHRVNTLNKCDAIYKVEGHTLQMHHEK